jgi:hypothetical protein
MARPQRETSRDYARPYRPRLIHAFNAAGRLPLLRHLLPRLEEVSLLAAARRKTGLEDFGDDAFREPLRVLLDSLNGESNLTPLGRIIQHVRIVGLLSNRLRTEELLKRHPEILQQTFGPVIVIAGLQRTGTTMLHRLLSADPDARSLLSWEALNPVPLPGETPGRPAGRMRQAQRAQRSVAYLAPDFFAVHPVEWEAPEEDVLLLDLEFMSQSPEATVNVPSYAAWLEGQDLTPAYQYERKAMLALQWQRPGRHWVLKTPHHMEYLDVLLRVFPEAKVVQTHRDPDNAVVSFCSMVAHARGLFSDDVEPHRVARQWVRKTRRMVERSMAVRDGTSADRILDVSYYDLVADPFAEVQRIYAFAGLPFGAKTRTAMEARHRENRQHKYGRHRYGLEDFGLTREDMDRAFDAYRRRYGIRREAG